jgi:hypothetical protein
MLVIEAPPEAIMDALADVEALLSYTPAYRRVEVLDRYDDGRPHHVRLAVRVLGRIDQEILEFRWGPNWLVWTPSERSSSTPSTSSTRCAPTTPARRTMVTVDVMVEPDSFIPDFFIKRAGKTVIDAANEGLRQRVLGDKSSDQSE